MAISKPISLFSWFLLALLSINLIIVALCYDKISDVQGMQKQLSSNPNAILYNESGLSWVNQNDGAPEFIEGVDESGTLSLSEIQQFKQSAIYKKYKDEPVVRASIDKAKEDGLITISEYYLIRESISDLSFIESQKNNMQKNAKEEKRLKAEIENM